MMISFSKVETNKIRNIRNLMAALIMPLALSATSSFAWAEASAIAYGNGNSWGWATRATQQEANRVALQGCNESLFKNGDSEKGCTLDTTKALARAEGGRAIGFGRSSISLADAKRNALESCGNAECKVVFGLTKPGFYSLFKSEKDANGDSDFYLAYQYSDSDKADRDAKQGCMKLTGQNCSLSWSGAIAGVYSVDSAPTPRISRVSAEKNCRPNTPSIRCSSQCTNGNCIVTYENGCKARIQVQPRYDGFTNQWTYPSPSC